MCVLVFNLMQSAIAGKTPTLQVRIKGRYVLRPSGNYRRTGQGQRPLL